MWGRRWTRRLEHLDALKRLAESGVDWAREALAANAPMLFVASAGFTESFHEVARALGLSPWTWTLEELF